MPSRFCTSADGSLTACPEGHVRTPISDHDPVPNFSEAEAAARHDQGVVVNTAYTSFDFHPQTLFLSGISCILILATVALCLCCYKKAVKLVKTARAPGQAILQ